MKTILILVGLAIALAGCSGSTENNNKTEPTALLVTVVTAVEKSYTPTISYSGTVFANREANLGAALPGKVERIFFAEGSKVKQGDLIVELSDEMLTQAKVENQALRKDYERVKRLREKESVSQIEYDHIKAQLEASDAKTEMITKNTRIFAPFAGTVVERMMEEGEVYFINPGLDPGYSMRSGIVRLMQLDPVKVKFDVNEKDLATVKPGLQVEITLDAFPQQSFTAKISTVKSMLSILTRTAVAEIVLANPTGNFKPGMFARVSVHLPQSIGVFVPMNCITRLPGTGEEFVYVVENEVARRVVVERVFTLGNLVAITGVSPNQKVVAEGKGRVEDGEKVMVRE
jgi:membrane fusion protein (multidrug efflux system)